MPSSRALSDDDDESQCNVGTVVWSDNTSEDGSESSDPSVIGSVQSCSGSLVFFHGHATAAALVEKEKSVDREDEISGVSRAPSPSPQKVMPFDIKRQTLIRGSNGGLGVMFSKSGHSSDYYSVNHLVRGGPADTSGAIQLGDLIMSVNDTPINSLSVDEVVGLMKGTPSSSVVLGVATPALNSGADDMTCEPAITISPLEENVETSGADDMSDIPAITVTPQEENIEPPHENLALIVDRLQQQILELRQEQVRQRKAAKAVVTAQSPLSLITGAARTTPARNMSSMHMWAVSNICVCESSLGALAGWVAGLLSLVLVCVQLGLFTLVIFGTALPACSTHDACPLGMYCNAWSPGTTKVAMCQDCSETGRIYNGDGLLSGLFGLDDCAVHLDTNQWDGALDHTKTIFAATASTGPFGRTTLDERNFCSRDSKMQLIDVGHKDVCSYDTAQVSGKWIWDSCPKSGSWSCDKFNGKDESGQQDPSNNLTHAFQPNASKSTSRFVKSSCLALHHCAKTDVMPRLCDHLMLNLLALTPGAIFILAIAALLLAVPMYDDMVQAAMEEAVLNHYFGDKKVPRARDMVAAPELYDIDGHIVQLPSYPVPTDGSKCQNCLFNCLRAVAAYPIRLSLCLRIHFVPWLTVGGAVALVISNPITARNIILSFVAIAFITQVDRLLARGPWSLRKTARGTACVFGQAWKEQEEEPEALWVGADRLVEDFQSLPDFLKTSGAKSDVRWLLARIRALACAAAVPFSVVRFEWIQSFIVNDMEKPLQTLGVKSVGCYSIAITLMSLVVCLPALTFMTFSMAAQLLTRITYPPGDLTRACALCQLLSDFLCKAVAFGLGTAVLLAMYVYTYGL